MSELKPCPFCGRAPYACQIGGDIDNPSETFVWCLSDSCANNQKVYKMSGWNRRAAPEPAPSDRERAGFWATKDCPACGGRGETYPLCPSCADSTEDHECPDPVKCKVCDERGEIVDTQLRDRLAAEFAAIRAEADPWVPVEKGLPESGMCLVYGDRADRQGKTFAVINVGERGFTPAEWPTVTHWKPIKGPGEGK